MLETQSLLLGTCGEDGSVVLDEERTERLDLAEGDRVRGHSYHHQLKVPKKKYKKKKSKEEKREKKNCERKERIIKKNS